VTPRPFYLAGEWRQGAAELEVRNPYDGSVASRVALADAAAVDEAVTRAAAAGPAAAALSSDERRRALRHIAAGIEARVEEFARTIALEAGKPVALARVEVRRAVETFSLAAGEVERWGGELLPVDLSPQTRGYRAMVARVPRGTVAAISPFNFPLNLLAHKVAPALAVGAPVVCKPPPQAPSAALLLAEIAHAAGLPAGSLSVLPCTNEVAARLVESSAVAVLSFTGSARVGWMLRERAGRKHVVLELGGNAAAVVCADADLAWAAERCALGGMAYAGQVCIAVQRIFVERAVYAPFVEKLVAEVRAMPMGDPMDEKTVVGPLIDPANCERVLAWIAEARAGGAQVLCGGDRHGNIVTPAVIEGARPDMKVSCEEVFGPVVTVEPFDAFDDALSRVNDGEYGLQSSVFTRDAQRIFRAWERLRVGGVIANDAPTLRVDNYPYGGTRASGTGREGVRSAMLEYTEPRVLVMAPR
jgi:glyceraldehyde-3-phosphate dehydrogenase (NADP+)